MKWFKPALAAIVVIGALWYFEQSRRTLAFYERQIAMRRVEHRQLSDSMNKLENLRAAHDWILGQARESGGESVTALMRSRLSGVKTDLVAREKSDAGQGWSIQVMDLRIDQISARQLSSFLAACENARPPVRLLDIQVTASASGRQMLVAQLALAELNPPAVLSNP
ncbi:MAG TPA: hypothetical protein PJ991_04560 [Kiritimatiellia bacterium]|nr:hypothetical protein [Kiritimatiellia bacterium]